MTKPNLLSRKFQWLLPRGKIWPEKAEEGSGKPVDLAKVKFKSPRRRPQERKATVQLYAHIWCPARLKRVYSGIGSKGRYKLSIDLIMPSIVSKR